ncbi:MAG: prepilin peptidase [Planctomycetaceae bacterium]
MGPIPPQWVLVTGYFAAGAFVGQWLSVAIERFPMHDRLLNQLTSLRGASSTCTYCGHPGSWWSRLPIVSRMFGEGRCQRCRRKKPGRPFVVELVTAMLFAVIAWHELPLSLHAARAGEGLYSAGGPPGPELITDLWHPFLWVHVRCLLHLAMICGLVVATFIDLEHRIIPDGSTVPIMLLAIAVSFTVGQVFIVPLWFQDTSVVRTLGPLLPSTLQPLIFEWNVIPFAMQHPHWHGLLVSLAGLAAGAGSVWIVRLIGFWIVKQEAMGFGDVVLMAMIGSVIGWQPVLTVFFIAPMLAVFAAGTMWLVRRDREIPYGPWLSLATIILLVGWKPLWPYAKRIFDMGPLLFLMGLGMTLSLAAMLQVVQLLKRLLGISADAQASPDVWTSADHLSYYNSPASRDICEGLARDVWPGVHSAQGKSQYRRWRDGG